MAVNPAVFQQALNAASTALSGNYFAPFEQFFNFGTPDERGLTDRLIFDSIIQQPQLAGVVQVERLSAADEALCGVDFALTYTTQNGMTNRIYLQAKNWKQTTHQNNPVANFTYQSPNAVANQLTLLNAFTALKHAQYPNDAVHGGYVVYGRDTVVFIPLEGNDGLWQSYQDILPNHTPDEINLELSNNFYHERANLPLNGMILNN